VGVALRVSANMPMKSNAIKNRLAFLLLISLPPPQPCTLQTRALIITRAVTLEIFYTRNIRAPNNFDVADNLFIIL
jgi:hypothetical protein